MDLLPSGQFCKPLTAVMGTSSSQDARFGPGHVRPWTQLLFRIPLAALAEQVIFPLDIPATKNLPANKGDWFNP